MNRIKIASSQVAWALLTEGVTQARVDLHRLRLMLDRAQALVEKSTYREHLWQMAGDIIQGIPESLSSAERSLDRTSYALSVMGEDFLRGRLPFDDRARVDGAVKTSPFSGKREKESIEARVARRYLQAQVQNGVAPSAEHYFFHNPELREVRQFNKSEAVSNLPAVAIKSVRESESPDRTIPRARNEAKKAPPTPTQIEEMPGGKQFSTLNRYLVKTEQPGVYGVPVGHDDIPKHPKLKR